MATSVLVCGITQSDVAIHFTSSILRMQSDLAATPNVKVDFEFFRTVNEALTYFHAQKRFDRLVVIDGQMSVDPSFILHQDTSKDFIVPSYPMRTFDWDRIKNKILDTDEPLSHVGIVYNYDPAKAIPQPGGIHVKISPGSAVQLKIFNISRKVIDDILKVHGDSVCASDKVAIYNEGVVNGVYCTQDERFATLWNGPIYADIIAKTKNVGPFDFSGVVGNRKQLR